MIRSRSRWIALGLCALLPSACREEAPDAGATAAPSASREPAVAGLLLTSAERERLGVRVMPCAEASAVDELEIYGRAIVDPAQRWTLRAPISGSLSAARGWPALGDSLSADLELGSMRPRLTVAEQLDLETRAAQARAEVAAGTEEVRAAQRELQRAAELNALDKAVSDKALEEARVRASLAGVRLEAAQEDELRCAHALAGGTAALGPVPLRVGVDARVVDILARPGEALEAGAPILELVAPAGTLAEFDLPAGAPASTGALRMQALSEPDSWWTAVELARRMGGSGSPVLLARGLDASRPLQPGEALRARIQVSATAIRGALLPTAAVVRSAGRTWCWVERDGARLLREAVALDHPAPGGWVITEPWARGAEVVVEGAQALLSIELLAGERGTTDGD